MIKHGSGGVPLMRLELQAFDHMLRERGEFYCVCAGTLLGAIRHGDIIPWDADIDLLLTEAGVDWAEQALPGLGYTVRRLIWPKCGFHHFLQVFSAGVQIDLWPSRLEPDLVHTYVGKYESGDVFPLRRQAMASFEVNVPNRAGVFLDRCYGRRWRSEIVKWTGWSPGGPVEVRPLSRPLLDLV